MIMSAIVSLSLFVMMQAIIEIPQHTKNKGMFSDNTLMGRSYLTTANEEVINKAPDYIFDPNLVMRYGYKIIICYPQSLDKPVTYINPNKKLIIKRSEIFL